jgi:hypothetical protein
VTTGSFTSSARLLSVRCENYLAFARPVEIELRPLTLILGRNNSGKSALVRLIRLALRASQDLGAQHVPLEIDGLHFGLRFLDLVHGRYFTRPVSIGMTLEIEGRRCGYDCEVIARDSSGDGTWIKKLIANDPGGASIQLELNLAAAKQPMYSDGRSHVFHGLLPVGEFGALRSAARAIEQSIVHLGPVRVPVSPVMEHDPHAGALGLHGQGAPQLLRNNRDLADSVDRWFRENLDDTRIMVSPQGDSFSLETTVREATDPAVVNLARAGEGVQQLLPVVIQQLRHQYDSGPFFDLVEQPELHLHDAVHPPLGDLFLNTARLNRGVVVVESHAEGLLLRVRRRIAEGAFAPADLAIYFIDQDPDGATAKRIIVNSDGELSDWPDGVFLESYREVVAIQRAIRARSPSA